MTHAHPTERGNRGQSTRWSTPTADAATLASGLVARLSPEASGDRWSFRCGTLLPANAGPVFGSHSCSLGSPGLVSTPRPPEDPPEESTRPQPPATPPPARVGVEREVAAPVEDPYRTELLLDQLRSLRTALAIVGVIAVAALAAALYTVLTKEEESDTGAGVSSQQVASLADRVDALEADVKTRATKNQVSQLSDDVKALSDRVDKVAKQSESAASSDNGGTDEQARSSIDKLDQSVQTLSQDVKDLDRRVRDLEDQTQQQQP